MSTTYGLLIDEVSAAVRDPDGKTFDATTVGSLVQAGLAEVGRIMPIMFQEDITPIADTLSYVLRSDAFSGEANPDIEVARVELWDGSVTPNTRTYVIPPASAGRISDSQVGWSNWGGTLSVPNSVDTMIDGNEDDYLYRVWGYSPHPVPTGEEDVVDVSSDGFWAVVAYAQAEALNRLVNDRSLYTQWQTRSGNTDISPAGLRAELMGARDDWRRRSRSLLRLRASI